MRFPDRIYPGYRPISKQEAREIALRISAETDQRARRYALLQAAAMIYAGGQHTVNVLPNCSERDYMGNWHTPQSAVTEAEGLLDVIEKREKEA